MNDKIQIVLIPGGMTFRSKRQHIKYLKNVPISIEKKLRWGEDYLDKNLGKGFNIIRPRMPSPDDAKYAEWKIAFERYIPLLRGKIILIGISLGGIFLAKYLSENKLPKKALSTYLICAPYDKSIKGEDLVGGFRLKSDIKRIEDNSKKVYLLFSEDDDIVPVSHAFKYKDKLTKANLIIFESKNGHFKIAEFPEIIRLIKSDAAKK